MLLIQRGRKFAEVIGWICIVLLMARGLYAFWMETPIGAAQGNQPETTNSGLASIPLYLDYEGYLTDMDGAPLTGYYTITLRIYAGVADPIGEELWAETHPNTPVRDGRFSVLLGNNTALPESLFDLSDRFIGATVAPFDELVPRQRLASVPYAVHADHAASLNAPDGAPTDAVFVDNGGNVGIGTTDPGQQLEVEGNTYLNGNLGIGVPNPQTALDVSGNVQIQGNLDVTGLSSIGPHFITPVTVISENGTYPWTTFDASAYIPQNATAVILEAEASNNSGISNGYIRIRRDNASPIYVLLRGRSAGTPDYVSWASQGIFPHNNRTFQFTIDVNGFNDGFVIRLIGYFK